MVQNITVNGSSVSPAASFTFIDVTTNHTISVTFTAPSADGGVKLTDWVWPPHEIPAPRNTWALISTTPVLWSGTGIVHLYTPNYAPPGMCADEALRVTTEHGQLTYGSGGYDWCGYPDITSIMQPGINTIRLETKNAQYPTTGIYETWLIASQTLSRSMTSQQYVQDLVFTNRTHNSSSEIASDAGEFSQYNQSLQ